jgi:hypothetical protein
VIVDLVLVGISCMIYRRRQGSRGEYPSWFDVLQEIDPISMLAARAIAEMDDLGNE